MQNINIHITGGSSGWAHADWPSWTNFDHNQWIVMFYRGNNDLSYGMANQLAHELGHILSLLHTYCFGGATVVCCTGSCSNGCDINYDQDEYLSDIFGNQPNGNCPHINDWYADAYDPTIINANKITNNLMGGNKSNSYISPKQAGQIHRALALSSARKYVNPVISDIPFEVFNDQIWDFNIQLYQDIVVRPGANISITCKLHLVPQATITIQNGSLLTIDGTVYMKADNYIIIEPGGEMLVTGTLDMGKHGRIIVKPGAKLTVDGGTITSSSDYPWHSIFVEGNPNLPQTFANQGALILNNAVIENGTDAIRLRSMASANNHNGGIIQATNTSFRNNCRNVGFSSYSFPSISFFSNCTFETDINTPHELQTSNVSLWNVQGVTFTNCTIKDTRPNIDYLTDGKSRDGIYSISASFVVDGCSFEGMKYGIHSTSSVANRTLKVCDSDFSSYNGIYFSNMNNSHVLGNTLFVKPGYMYSGPSPLDTTIT
jgi:hypothetical protein